MRIPRMNPEGLSPEGHALYASITGGPRGGGPQHFALAGADGALNGPFNAFLLSPAVGDALQQLGAAIRYRTTLTDRAREIAILLVAARWSSEFERASHESVGMAAGLSVEELTALRTEDLTPFSGEDALIARTIVALLDGDLGDAEWQDAAAGLGAPTVFELTALVGYYTTLALQLRVFRV